MEKQCLYRNKKSGFIKKQEVGGLLSKLEIKTALSKIAKLGDFLL